MLFALISWRRAVGALVAGTTTVFMAANTAEIVWALHAVDVMEQACRETTGRASLEDNSCGVMWVECQDGVATEAYRAVDVGESLAWDFSRACFDVR